MKIVFFGTSEFGAIILEKLVQAGMAPVLVVTTPDKPAGRKQEFTSPPVKLIAEKFKLPIFQPANLVNSAIAELTRQKIDMFIVAAYGKILPKGILNIPQYGALNVHPSLLPKYRGPSPIQTAILNDEDETGVTIMLMDEKMDHGPIVANSKFEIRNSKFTYPELHSKLAEIGADLLVKMIPDWIEGKIKPVPQDEGKATYTRILKKEDGKIDWNQPATEIERQVRALTPWPGTFTLFKGKTLKILKASVLPGTLPKPGLGRITPGAVFLTAEKKLAIKCGGDALLVEELQLEGGKPMSAREFLLGHKDFLGIVLSPA